MSDTHTPGQRYRVIFSDETTTPKQIIAVFLGLGGSSGQDYLFDGRPSAGTITLRPGDVKAMTQTEMPVQPIPSRVGTARGR